MEKAVNTELAVLKWASPIVSVPKKDGSVQFCVYYRLLNTVIVCDSYVIPRIDVCIDYFEEAKLCFTLDTNLGYEQTKMGENTLIRQH